MQNWTAQFNRLLITTVVRNTRRPEVREAIESALKPSGNLWDFEIYFTALALAWILLLVALVAASALVGSALSLVHVPSRAWTASAITWIATFCLIGGVDAWLRLVVVSRGIRHFERNRLKEDERTRRLQSLSTVARDFTLAIQFITTLAVAVALR